METVEIKLWLYVLLYGFSTMGTVCCIILLVKLRSAQKDKWAYKTLLDCRIGLDGDCQWLYQAADTLARSIRESFKRFPHPGQDQEKADDLMLRIQGFLGPLAGNTSRHAMLQDLVGEVDTMYHLQLKHHLTADITLARSHLQVRLDQYNAQVREMMEARARLPVKERFYTIPQQISFAVF